MRDLNWSNFCVLLGHWTGPDKKERETTLFVMISHVLDLNKTKFKDVHVCEAKLAAQSETAVFMEDFFVIYFFKQF